MDFLQNLDLLAVGVTVAAIGVMGFAVFLNNRKSVTNITLFLFSLCSIVYGVLNYLSYQNFSPEIFIFLLRLTIFFAFWYSFILFQLFYVFPYQKVTFPPLYKYLFFPTVLVVSILTLTPLVFSDVNVTYPSGEITKTNGPGIYLFGIFVLFLVIGGIGILFKKMLRATGSEKVQLRLVFIGTLITYSLILFFNMVMPAFFNNATFVPFAPLFTMPFILFTSYSILKHKLFNIKVVAVALLVFVLAVVTFLEVIFTTDLGQIIFRSGVFMMVLIIGILMIRSVLREVEQREKIQALAGELASSNDQLFVVNEKLNELNKQKTEFVSIASHQLRSPLTAIKGYSSMLLEGSFGELGERVKGAVEVVYESSQKLVAVVEDFLNVTRIELGKMKYVLADFDLAKMVTKVVEELQMAARRKGLALSFTPLAGADYRLNADEGKLTQVAHNLIDNALKYTERGQVAVKLLPLNSVETGATGAPSRRFRLEIQDTGVGIEPATLPKLFQKFTRADQAEANTGGTGLGLFVAKQIVEGHGGRVWAESAGPGRGSTFIVEI